MYKISKYLIASMAIAMLFVAPFMCSRPGNQVNIDRIDGESNVEIYQKNGEPTIIFIGDSISKGYSGYQSDTVYHKTKEVGHE